MMNKKGFTLVELMVVIVIIGVLAAVALPKFADSINKSRASEIPKKLNEISAQASIYEGETGNYPASIGDITITGTSKFFSYTGAVVTGQTSGISEFRGTATGLGGNGSWNESSSTVWLETDGSKGASGNISEYVAAFLNN